LTPTDRVLFPWAEATVRGNPGDNGMLMESHCPHCGIDALFLNQEDEFTHTCGNYTCGQKYNVRRKS
jgi:hypothetical protein